MVSNNYYLNKAAKDAYRSYILAYNSHSMKDIFNVHRLDLQVLVLFSMEHEAKFYLFLSEEMQFVGIVKFQYRSAAMLNLFCTIDGAVKDMTLENLTGAFVLPNKNFAM